MWILSCRIILPRGVPYLYSTICKCVFTTILRRRFNILSHAVAYLFLERNGWWWGGIGQAFTHHRSPSTSTHHQLRHHHRTNTLPAGTFGRVSTPLMRFCATPGRWRLQVHPRRGPFASSSKTRLALEPGETNYFFSRLFFLFNTLGFCFLPIVLLLLPSSFSNTTTRQCIRFSCVSFGLCVNTFLCVSIVYTR